MGPSHVHWAVLSSEGSTMGDLLGHILEGLLRVLVEAANWIPLDSIDEVWAWPIGFCLVVSAAAFGFALYLGHPGLYQLTLGAVVGAFGFVCVGGWFSRPRRGG
jgi:hypothetical protein